MSDAYLAGLVVTVVLIVTTRFLIAVLPVPRWAAPMTATDVALFAVGCLGLALHCGAMFFPTQVRSLPGGPQVIHVVDPLASNSILWYAIAATLVIAGLRHQHIAAVILAATALSLVGYTMYDGGHLNTHLTVIFATVVLLAAILALLVVPPRRARQLPLVQASPCCRPPDLQDRWPARTIGPAASPGHRYSGLAKSKRQPASHSDR